MSFILQMSNYSSMDGVLYCKPHFEQLFKESGNFSKNFQTCMTFFLLFFLNSIGIVDIYIYIYIYIIYLFFLFNGLTPTVLHE